MQQTACRTEGVRCFRCRKTLSVEQHNKQFASDYENSTCPLLAFTHAFNLLVKFLTALFLGFMFHIRFSCKG